MTHLWPDCWSDQTSFFQVFVTAAGICLSNSICTVTGCSDSDTSLSFPPGKSFIVAHSLCSIWNSQTKQSLQVCSWLLVQQKEQHEGQWHSVHVMFTIQVLIWAGNCRLYFLNFLFTFSSSERLHRLFPFFIHFFFCLMLLVGYSLSVFDWCFSFFAIHFTTIMLLLMLMPTCPHCGTNKEIFYLILSGLKLASNLDF